MNINRVISAIVISIILASASVAIIPTIKAAPTFHVIKGTLYIGDEVAGAGIDIKFEVPELSFSAIYPTIEQDQNGYNFYSEGFDHVTYGGKTVHFKVKYEGSFVSPIDNKSIVLDKDTYPVAEYILDLHIEKTSNGGNGGNGGGGTTGGGGGGGDIIAPPTTADASASETFGYIGESINFDGSLSTSDGTIDLYEWDWDNDGFYDYNSTSSTATHTFDEEGTYSVTLRVTDNVGATDTDTIDVIISKANVPPTEPTIDGPQDGTKGDEYSYTFRSTDADNDTIQYIINWNDDGVTETEFLPNGTATIQSHSWLSAGKYIISVTAYDNSLAPSGTTEYTVLIDVHLVDDIGYLIDDDADETYDSFHNDTSGQETDVEKQDDGTYLLDDDGDGSWDWIYDIETDTLTEYSEPTPEPDNSALIVLAIIVILFLIILGYLVKRSNDKKKAQKKAAEKKSQPKKKTTSKKSKK